MVQNLIWSLGSIVEPSLYMDVVLFSSHSFRKHLRVRESEREAREQVQRARKENKCLILVPPPCQLLIIISSAFAVPIKLDQ